MLDWRTEEDNRSWQEEPAPPTPPRQRFFLLMPLLALLLLVGGGYYGYWQVRQRMASNVREVQTAVLTSHELLIHAASTSDAELFANLLSSRDAEWTNGQLEMFQRRLLFNRPQMGLATAEIRAGDATIILSPDLEEATVRRPVRYTVLGTEEAITLEQVNFYRRGAERWLLAPLDTAAWRTTQSFSGTFIEATFPEADTAVLRPLIGRLDEAMSTTCGLFDVRCPANMRLYLTFSTDPRTLYALNTTATPRLAPTERLTLPTVGLLGYPVDEAGAQILYQTYGRWVVGDVLQRGLANYWLIHDPLRTLAYQERLAKLEITPRPTAIPLPPTTPFAQDVAARCLADDGLHLVQYRPPLATQTQLRGMVTGLAPAPDGRVVAITQLAETTTTLSLWFPHTTHTTLLGEYPTNDGMIPAWRTHPAGARLLVARYSPTNGGTTISQFVFDKNCQQGVCPFVRESQVDNLVWSPNGQWTLGQGRDGHQFVGDGAGVRQYEVAAGSRPFWLGNDEYAILQYRPQFSAADRLLKVQVANPQTPTLWLTSDDLRMALPEEQRPPSLGLLAAVPWGTDGRHFLIEGWANSQPDAHQRYFFHYDGQTAVLRYLLTVPVVTDMVLAPTATHLAFWVEDTADKSITHLYVYDRQTTALESFPLPGARALASAKWSADGQWLLATIGGQPYLIPAAAPHTLYRTPLTGCAQAVWVATE